MTKVLFDLESLFYNKNVAHILTRCPHCDSLNSSIQVYTGRFYCMDCKKRKTIRRCYAEIEESHDEIEEPAKEEDKKPPSLTDFPLIYNTEVVADDNGRFSHIENHLAFLENALKKMNGHLIEVKLRPQPDMTVVGDKFNRINNAMNETENRLAVMEKRLYDLERRAEEPTKKREEREEINRLSKPAVVSGIPEPNHKVGEVFKCSYKEYCCEDTSSFLITNVICLENGKTFNLQYIYEASIIPSHPERPPYYFSEDVVDKGKEHREC